MSDLLVHAWQCIDWGLLDGAQFAAERLLAAAPSGDAHYVYAQSLWLANRSESAAAASRDISHPGCAYVYGQCCLKLGTPRSGIKALEEARSMWDISPHEMSSKANEDILHNPRARTGKTSNENKHRKGSFSKSHQESANEEIKIEPSLRVPPRAVFLLLLGRLHLALDSFEPGINALTLSAKENPYLWENCKILCDQRRIKFSPSAFFPEQQLTMRPEQGDRSDDALATQVISAAKTGAGSGSGPQSAVANSTMNSSFVPQPLFGDSDDAIAGFVAQNNGPLDPFLTPTMPPPSQRPLFTDVSSSFAWDSFDINGNGVNNNNNNATANLMATPARLTMPAPLHNPRQHTLVPPLFGDTNLSRPQLNPPGLLQRPIAAGSMVSPQSASSNFGSRGNQDVRTLTAVAESSADFPATPLPQRLGKGRRLFSAGEPDWTPARAASSGSDTANSIPNPRFTLASLYEPFVAAQQLLGHYKCQEALAALDRLPDSQKGTPQYYVIQALSCFRQLDYRSASKSFALLRKVDPHRIENMETYSKVLWQLRNELELAALAHELSSVSRSSWQTWCVFGDLRSLVHDSVQALKCYRRATQLATRAGSQCAGPAYSLLGHELADNDELQSASEAFCTALRYDPENLNAWFGLGMVLFRLGDLDGADAHIGHALRLHPENAVLHTFAGTVCEERGRHIQALSHFRRATESNPENMTARFKLAEALIAAKMPSEALRELAALASRPPNANVQLALGRAYKAIGKPSLALKHFTKALNLDPRVSASARAEMNQLNQAS